MDGDKSLSLKAWLVEEFFKGKLPDFIYRFIGREAAAKLDLKEGNLMDTKPWYQSKTIWTAIIGVLLGAVQPISAAFGHPITVPNWVFEVLGAAGLYSVRTGSTPIA